MLTLLRCLKPAAHESYSAELTVTRAYWRKQVLPVCGEILRVFVTRAKNLSKFCRAHGRILLTPMVTSEFLLSR